MTLGIKHSSKLSYMPSSYTWFYDQICGQVPCLGWQESAFWSLISQINLRMDFESTINQGNVREILVEQQDAAQVIAVAQKFINADKQVLGFQILDVLSEQPMNHAQIHSLLSDAWLLYLQNKDQRVQDHVVKIIGHMIPGLDFTAVMGKLIDELLRVIVWDNDYKKRISMSRLAKDLTNAPFPSLENRVKILEPLFQCKYYFTNEKDQFVQGYYAALKLFVRQRYLFEEKVTEIIEILMRSSQHQNRYVRIATLHIIQLMLELEEHHNWKLIIRSVIQNGMIDESIEVRMEALKVYNQLKSLHQEQFMVPLLLNCHTENVMEYAAQVAQQHFPCHQQGPPILGLITIVRKNHLHQCIQYCCESTLSRYFQLRCSGLSTLQSLLLFMKNEQNALPYQTIAKFAQNATFFESDPQVRQVGLSLLFHLLRLHIGTVEDKLELLTQNFFFHLSDVPQSCKEFSAKCISVIWQQRNLKEEIERKLDLLRDRDRLFYDFLGMEVIPQEQQQAVEKNIQSQGGREKVISKHAAHILWGVALCFRYVAQWSETNEELLRYLIVSVAQGLKYVDLYQQQIFESLVEGLVDLKHIKRLPVKLLDETDILKMMKSLNLDGLLNKVGGIIGQNILQGRL